MKKGRQMAKMAVVRGVQPRMSEVNFYSHFQHLEIKVIGDQRTGWIVKEKIPQQVEFIHSPLYPVWGFDPWTGLFGPLYAHRSWQFVKDLEKHVADCQVLNISDLFYFYCWQSARISQRYKKKLAAIVWENVPRHASTFLPPYSFGVRKVLEVADLFIARSQGAQDYLLSIGADKKKIKVVYKGIDLRTFRPRARKKDGQMRILYVGQLVESKGVLELITAFERLCQEFDSLELMLLGRSYGERLEKKIKTLATRLPIIVKTKVDYNKIPQVYHRADIYCQLSQDWKYLGLVAGGNDWFPYAIMEAMASGLPVVATRVGGIPEQLGREGNLFVKQKDAAGAYQALRRLILDQDLRSKIGQQNRKRAEKLFDVKKQAKKTEEKILEILER